MRSSTSFALLVLASAAVPTLAASIPFSQPTYSPQEAARSLLARESRFTNEVLSHIKLQPHIYSTSFLHPPKNILAREPRFTDDVLSHIKLQPHIYSTSLPPPPKSFFARDDQFGENLVRELMARASEDESGAFVQYLVNALPYIGKIAKGFVKGIAGKREFEEMVARDMDENFVRELMARASEDESGAFVQYLVNALPYIGKIAKGFVKGIAGKREFDDMLARDIDENFVRELVARAEAGDEQSGAFVQYLVNALPYIGKIAKGFVKGLAGKRELEDMILARQTSLNELD